MLRLFSAAALAVPVAFAPASSVDIAVKPPVAAVTPAAAAPAPRPAPAPDPEAQFGLHAHADREASGLAPGQSASEFRRWLAASPANRAALGDFRDYLAARGVGSVVPLWQLVRTSSSWRECGAQPFEAPPRDKWDHMVKTLHFVRDEVVPAVGKVEALSAYRNETLNACSNGAPASAHRHFFALDLTPVNKAVDRDRMIRTVCAAHARDGSRYDTGLGFYNGRRFHVDSSGFRKWGPNGKGATSPCLGRTAHA